MTTNELRAIVSADADVGYGRRCMFMRWLMHQRYHDARNRVVVLGSDTVSYVSDWSVD